MNNFESFKAIEKDLLLIEDDEEWNTIVVKAHDSFISRRDIRDKKHIREGGNTLDKKKHP